LILEREKRFFSSVNRSDYLSDPLLVLFIESMLPAVKWQDENLNFLLDVVLRLGVPGVVPTLPHVYSWCGGYCVMRGVGHSRNRTAGLDWFRVRIHFGVF
jgi:hypothetical protein